MPLSHRVRELGFEKSLTPKERRGALMLGNAGGKRGWGKAIALPEEGRGSHLSTCLKRAPVDTGWGHSILRDVS